MAVTKRDKKLYRQDKKNHPNLGWRVFLFCLSGELSQKWTETPPTTRAGESITDISSKNVPDSKSS